MGLFDFFKGQDINRGIEDFHQTPGALLLDVRTPEEYRQGHIPDSRNVSLQSLDNVRSIVGDKDTPLFVYCLSGSRSRQAVNLLGSMGYTNVRNIGGIANYKGKVVR